MLQKFAAIVAWACLIFIIYATLSFAGRRPELTESEPMLAVFVERFGAYGLLGVCSAWRTPVVSDWSGSLSWVARSSLSSCRSSSQTGTRA